MLFSTVFPLSMEEEYGGGRVEEKAGDEAENVLPEGQLQPGTEVPAQSRQGEWNRQKGRFLEQLEAGETLELILYDGSGRRQKIRAEYAAEGDTETEAPLQSLRKDRRRVELTLPEQVYEAWGSPEPVEIGLPKRGGSVYQYRLRDVVQVTPEGIRIPAEVTVTVRQSPEGVWHYSYEAAPARPAEKTPGRTGSFLGTGSEGHKSLQYVTSSGVQLEAVPGKTTTVLGRYLQDTKSIIEELGLEPSLDFGAKEGGFNLLNTPPEEYITGEQFWRQHNKPWLDAAIERGDVIVLATKPEITAIVHFDRGTGKIGLTGFGRECYYLTKQGYYYDRETMTMRKRMR